MRIKARKTLHVQTSGAFFRTPDAIDIHGLVREINQELELLLFGGVVGVLGVLEREDSGLGLIGQYIRKLRSGQSIRRRQLKSI